MLANVLQQLATAISSSTKSSVATSAGLPRGLSAVPCHRLDAICKSFVMLPARLFTSGALWWLDVWPLLLNDSAKRTECKARRANDTLACKLAGSTDGAAALIATTACTTTSSHLKVKRYATCCNQQHIALKVSFRLVYSMQHKYIPFNKKTAWRKVDMNVWNSSDVGSTLG